MAMLGELTSDKVHLKSLGVGKYGSQAACNSKETQSRDTDGSDAKYTVNVLYLPLGQLPIPVSVSLQHAQKCLVNVVAMVK